MLHGTSSIIWLSACCRREARDYSMPYSSGFGKMVGTLSLLFWSPVDLEQSSYRSCSDPVSLYHSHFVPPHPEEKVCRNYTEDPGIALNYICSYSFKLFIHAHKFHIPKEITQPSCIALTFVPGPVPSTPSMRHIYHMNKLLQPPH